LQKPAILALEDGSVFHGNALGHIGHSVGEVVFNTAMSGYQEIISDPSYHQQIITFTYPHIGNVGCNALDDEAKRTWSAGVVIRNESKVMSNWRAEQSLDEYLKAHQIVGISGVDTRALTRLLRDQGALRGCIASDDTDSQKAIERARSFPGLEMADLATVVTTQQPITWQTGSWTGEGKDCVELSADEAKFHIVAFDYGVKHNILRLFVDRGCKVTLLPATASPDTILKLNPDGVFLSNGPGDPAACDNIITTVKALTTHDMPIFGICLGCQLLALASGAETFKMKFGHHGGNHPVQDLRNGRVMITAQNHGFAIREETLPDSLEVTHRSLFDGTVQGIRSRDGQLLAFQGHPEASPGPRDIQCLFDEFMEMVAACQSAQT